MALYFTTEQWPIKILPKSQCLHILSLLSVNFDRFDPQPGESRPQAKTVTVEVREEQADSQKSGDDDKEATWCKCQNCPAMERRTERVCCINEHRWQELYNKDGEFIYFLNGLASLDSLM